MHLGLCAGLHMCAIVHLSACGVSVPLLMPQEAPKQVQTIRNKRIICII